MREEFARRKLVWIQLTGQQLNDILLYLQNLPETRNLPRKLELAASGSGEELFRSKGCVSCHTGTLALENRLHNQTLTDSGVSLPAATNGKWHERQRQVCHARRRQ